MTHENPCYNEAEKAAGREMSKAELDEMFGRLEKEAGRYMKQGLSPREALEKAGARMADEERLAGIIEANARKKNLIVRAELRRRIVASDEAASLEGILAGKQTRERDAALSVDGLVFLVDDHTLCRINGRHTPILNRMRHSPIHRSIGIEPELPMNRDITPFLTGHLPSARLSISMIQPAAGDG
ncbi:hypothetical protein AL01_01075 [Bombella intestini]|uniref:Uncharacterized protein n=1 Tax=Bombella intestini TaxID=1539051 RepID=A0A1S8GRK1_9PROT|nr:hypothetical protein [Bombella intestini]OOL19605.1 hypothetical protein AL01_01075 [Bombella intestini]